MPMLSKPIASGRTAEVYAWGEGLVLKLFRDWYPPEAAESEARIARAVHAAGVASPWAGELIEVNERKGLVYERLDGLSMAQVFMRRPWQAGQLAQQFASLHVAMHQVQTREPPDQRERLAQKISTAQALPEHLRGAALRALADMPEAHCLCHGDYHPGNILMTRRGPMVIDWIDVTSGHPLADLARSYLIINNIIQYMGFIRLLIQGGIRKFAQVYRETYFQLVPGDQNLMERWLPIVAAARLNENIPQEEKALLAMVKGYFSGETMG